MFRYRWKLVIIAALIAGRSSTTGNAEELSMRDGGIAALSTAAGTPQGFSPRVAWPTPAPAQRKVVRLPPVDAVVSSRQGRPSAPQSLPPRQAEGMPLPANWAGNRGAGISPRSFGAASTAAGQGVDGTWREDANFIIINLDGKEVKLRKSASEQSRTMNAPISAAEGTVQGRLLQHGAPLINCRVVMVPMEREGMGDESRDPVIGMTDDLGVYRFEKVPAGKYKLTWLPAGTTQWIRRIEMKPDVVVRPGQTVVVKDIRAALRTIN